MEIPTKITRSQTQNTEDREMQSVLSQAVSLLLLPVLDKVYLLCH